MILQLISDFIIAHNNIIINFIFIMFIMYSTEHT